MNENNYDLKKLVYAILMAVVLVVAGFFGMRLIKDEPTPTEPTPTPVVSQLSYAWVSNPEEKITLETLRNSGQNESATLFAAKNEVVSFNVVLESKDRLSDRLSVEFNSLKHDGGYEIKTSHADVSNYVGRNIELFYVRYLKIKGLSRLSYETYDERHVPKAFQRPYDQYGIGSGSWLDRPDHDRSYPEYGTPFERVEEFTIPQNKNQSIMVDIYVPKDAAPGEYHGTFQVTESGQNTISIPVTLTVNDFELPDVPNSKTMVFYSRDNLESRYGSGSLDAVVDNHFKMAHRHKISLIDANRGSGSWLKDQPRPEWIPRLDGSLFTKANGYDGPGLGTGNNVFSIGTYGGWSWKNENKNSMITHADNWSNWFKQNSPDTEYFLYLVDESSDYAQTETWASWAKGHIPTFATLGLPSAVNNVPSLGISASWIAVADKDIWSNAYLQARDRGMKVYMYNGRRPGSGSFATEDDGVALRELAWGQYKMGIDRWFFWESTYYNDYQGGRGQTDVFKTAATFSGPISKNDSLGETGWNYSNGDGVLFYPGRDLVSYPQYAEAFGNDMPIASLRLKHWRRGIQDVDYIVMANKIDPVRTKAIVDRMVPKVLWEVDVAEKNDPTWNRTDISWSINPQDWEDARKELSNIILGK